MTTPAPAQPARPALDDRIAIFARDGQPAAQPAPSVAVMTTSAVTVGEAITSVIGRRSQTEVARGIGVSPSTMNRWISGEYTPGYEDLARIEEFCGVAPGSILHAAGYVSLPVTFEELIAMDPRLSAQGRRMLLALWETATKNGADPVD